MVRVGGVGTLRRLKGPMAEVAPRSTKCFPVRSVHFGLSTTCHPSGNECGLNTRCVLSRGWRLLCQPQRCCIITRTHLHSKIYIYTLNMFAFEREAPHEAGAQQKSQVTVSVAVREVATTRF